MVLYPGSLYSLPFGRFCSLLVIFQKQETRTACIQETCCTVSIDRQENLQKKNLMTGTDRDQNIGNVIQKKEPQKIKIKTLLASLHLLQYNIIN